MTDTTDIIGQNRLVIHLGVQKTGTTSFHHFVQRNQDLLSPYLYLRLPERETATRSLGRAAVGFSHAPEKPGRKDELIACIKAVRKEVLEQDVTCLLSHENLAGAMLGYRNSFKIYPRLEQLIALYQLHFAPLVPEFVLTTRDVSSWKESVYNQSVKSDRSLLTRDEFMHSSDKFQDWLDLQKRLELATNETRSAVFAIEDEPSRLRPGQQLLRFAGVPQSVIDILVPSTGRSNTSINAGGLEFIRIANGASFERDARRKLVALVQQNQSLFRSEELTND